MLGHVHGVRVGLGLSLIYGGASVLGLAFRKARHLMIPGFGFAKAFKSIRLIGRTRTGADSDWNSYSGDLSHSSPAHTRSGLGSATISYSGSSSSLLSESGKDSCVGYSSMGSDSGEEND